MELTIGDQSDGPETGNQTEPTTDNRQLDGASDEVENRKRMTTESATGDQADGAGNRQSAIRRSRQLTIGQNWQLDDDGLETGWSRRSMIVCIWQLVTRWIQQLAIEPVIDDSVTTCGDGTGDRPMLVNLVIGIRQRSS